MVREKGERRLMRFLKKINTVKALFICLLCLVVVITAVLWLYDDAVQPLDNSDSVIFFDVGQGDSALIKSGDYAALIDTGTATNGLNIAKKLRREGVDKLDALILSHPHDDHIGSAEFLLDELPVENIILSDVLVRDDENARCYNDIKAYAQSNDINCYFAQEGMVINIGNFELTVLMCDNTAKDENDTSIIIMAENSDNKFLFMGDAEISAENKLISNKVNFDCDVLKVGHHGSNSSTSLSFLDVATPKYAVISCGENNPYSHPHNDILTRLRNEKINIYRTDYLGDIKFDIKNGKLFVKAK